MKLVTRSCICAALFSGFAIAALAQQSEPLSFAPIDAPQAPLRVDAVQGETRIAMPDPTQGLIRVDVEVTDKARKPVSDLSEKDFTLLDNDQPQRIVTFQPGGRVARTANPLEIVLVIDELNMLPSVQDGKKELSNAIREVETFLGPGHVLENPTIIYRLTGDGLFATPHVSIDPNELKQEMEQPELQRRIWSPSEISREIGHLTAGGEVSSRITHSLMALGSIAIEERRRPGRKLLFWIGNGWQIENRRAAAISDFSIELLTRMREARISLWGASKWPLYDASGHAVPVTDYVYKEYLEGPKPDSISLGYLSLPVIAARSGGGILNAPNHLAALISKHIKEESNDYSLTFDPPRTNAMDEYHHLQIQINRPDLTAHVFEDYYDEPAFYDQPPVTEPASVMQLEALIANARDISGADLTRQLNRIELTERLSSAKLAALEKQVHGGKAREALEVVADESVFLPPPADEILSTPPPDLSTQRDLISRTVSYVNTTIPKLPDFFATRTTLQYHEPALQPHLSWKTAPPDQTLHEGEIATASVRFHDGRERVEDQTVRNAPHEPGSERLGTIGTFGPILVNVMTAATSAGSELRWSRWEKGRDGPLAVFRYRVPQETRLFSAEFCCLANDFGAVLFKKASPFHGEITVDPSSGTIFRLTIEADLESRLPLERSGVMVEYATLQRRERTFVGPSRSVSISRQRRTMAIDEWAEEFKVYAPFETLLNEMRFEKYRVFGSTSRILPGYVEVPEKKP